MIRDVLEMFPVAILLTVMLSFGAYTGRTDTLHLSRPQGSLFDAPGIKASLVDGGFDGKTAFLSKAMIDPGAVTSLGNAGASGSDLDERRSAAR